MWPAWDPLTTPSTTGSSKWAPSKKTPLKRSKCQRRPACRSSSRGPCKVGTRKMEPALKHNSSSNISNSTSNSSNCTSSLKTWDRASCRTQLTKGRPWIVSSHHSKISSLKLLIKPNPCKTPSFKISSNSSSTWSSKVRASILPHKLHRSSN